MNTCNQVKGLDIPAHHTSYGFRRKSVADTSLEDANRIIFSPWDAISGYEEPVTDNVIDIPGNIAGILGIPDVDRTQKNREEGPTRLFPERVLIANKSNSPTEDEKSNKSSAYSQLVIRVETKHFHKVSWFMLPFIRLPFCLCTDILMGFFLYEYNSCKLTSTWSWIYFQYHLCAQ